MAFFLFSDYAESILLPDSAAAISLINDTINVVMVDEAVDTPVPTDTFLSALNPACLIGTPQTLAGKAIGAAGAPGAAFTASNVQFSGISAPPCNGILVYKSTGNAATSRLICYVSGASVVSGLPTTAGAFQIDIDWNSNVIQLTNSFSQMFANFSQSLFDKDDADAVDFENDTIKAILVNSIQTPNQSWSYLSSVGAPVRVGTPQTLNGKVVSLVAGPPRYAMFDADNIGWAGLVAAPTIGSLILYKDTGNEATSPLICWLDSSNAAQFPISSGETDVNVTWSVNGVIRLQSSASV